MKLNILPIWLVNAYSHPQNWFFWGGDFTPEMGSNINETHKRQPHAQLRVV